MKSIIGIDELLENLMATTIKYDHYIPDGTWCTAQDTEDDNTTECYVYVPVEHKDDLPYVNNRMAEALGLPRDYCAEQEAPDSGHPDEYRLEFIVTICHRTSPCESFV